ncbi:polysaccharide export protein [Bacteroides intestinalis]|jgi:polysaccharide export outer membrane protein|uniref:polysaccharide biosynthesis/export family protein n=1 Tax=Bacteroides intestinalis TaxID=329854 RepID=UPI000E443554|nr:polysaccharide biosynthesis/export family protein [Bacteroides intestinalis]RGK26992.1 polysaccharide export protein [Bacteroides intestinalis]
MKIKTLIPVFSLLLLMSCKTTTNNITYFQDLDNLAAYSGDNINYAPKIVPDDELSISVSGVDPNAVAVFNMPLSSYLTPGETSVNITPALHTYLVDSKGNIDFPVLGKISVGGMTRSELTDLITKKLTTYVKDPIVTIQIRNFKVSVLGEVTKPGTVSVPNERLSVLDAIGMAGDLTIYGNRKNVLLIRDNGGKKEYHRFDLTSIESLNSPYYYLQQNDVLYVEPNKARKGNAKYSQSQQFNISLASTVISAISVLASLAIALLVK